MFTKYLQEAFNVPLVIQITDDEKFLHKDLSLATLRDYAVENIKDIIAVGFDPAKTFIFLNTEYIAKLYPTVLQIEKLMTLNQVKNCFGIEGGDNIGKVCFPAIQAAPCFPACFPHLFGAPAAAGEAKPPQPGSAVSARRKQPQGQAAAASKPSDRRQRKNRNRKRPDKADAANGAASTAHPVLRCLVPQGIDQDPYFRLTRDVAPRMGLLKPALVHGKFVPSLLGMQEKMGSSDPNSAVFLTDSAQAIKTKIMRFAFSGGRQTLELHRQLGADLSVDVPYAYLRCFLADDKELDQIAKDYSAGKLLTSEVKQKLVQVLQEVVTRHQQARKAITPEVLARFMPRV